MFSQLLFFYVFVTISKTVLVLHQKGGGIGFPNTFRDLIQIYSLLINLSLGMYQNLPPSGPISLESVKINSSLVVMRECDMRRMHAW